MTICFLQRISSGEDKVKLRAVDMLGAQFELSVGPTRDARVSRRR